MFNTQTKKIIGSTVLVLIVALGIGYIAKTSDNNTKEETPVHTTGWFKGGENAQVVLTEYSDFQCPACRAYSEVLGGLSDQFGDNLKIIYKHFPLKQIHFNATVAAQAAEAAGLQGKFWEMHDILFLNQEEWSEIKKPQNLFEKYAQEIGLDIEKFKQDSSSSAVRSIVRKDYTSGTKIKVNYTPYFLLNGKKINNPKNLDGFKQIIKEAIKEAQNQSL